jgi:hypothetical protein
VICSTNAIESLKCPLPPPDQGPWALPLRTGRDEVPLPGNPIAGPNRGRQGTMDDAVEPALSAFAITFGDRFPAAETY